MPTILSHPAVPLALAAIAGRKHITPALLAAGIVASMLPDADVLGHGIYRHGILGHRGLSHSLLFAVVWAGLGAICFRKRRRTAFIFIFLAMASHGMLDAATDGGSGIAFFSPIYNHRYFWPWTPIEVSSLGFRRVFTERFITVLGSEFRWIWAPCICLGAVGLVARRIRSAFARQGKPSFH